MHNSLPVFILIASLVGLLSFNVLVAWKRSTPSIPTVVSESQHSETPSSLVSNASMSRESITFIMGEDGETPNFFYTKAQQYFGQNDEARTEYLEMDCRSLRELRDHLEANPPHNGAPWGRINVVVHSNAWSNLGVPVLPEGKRANTAALLSAMDEGKFMPLSDDIMDKGTEMVLHGCGLGNDEGFLETVSLAFGGEDDPQRPSVHSPRYFVTYDVNQSLGFTSESATYYSKPHYAFYKTGYHPGNHELAQELKENYPEEPIQWVSALGREEPRFLGDTYTHNFRIPMVYIVTFPDKQSRPSLKTDSAKVEWLTQEAELQDKINEIGIDAAYFQWTVQRIPYELEDGSKVPAIKAIGLCQVACVLQAITELDPDHPGTVRPIQPQLSDSRFFGSSE